MSTYAGITFRAKVSGSQRPHWERAANISRRHIPYANKDDIQDAGQGNWTLSTEVVLAADADIVTLQAAVGLTLRTLVIWGDTYTNTMLTGISNIRRIATAQVWWATLSFEREGT